MDSSTELGRVHPHHQETYEHTKNVKRGSERLDRRSAAGVHGQPKKSGHGGKFTWGGPTAQEESRDDSVVALDEKDPNYDDGELEEFENKKAAVHAGNSADTDASQAKEAKVPVAN